MNPRVSIALVLLAVFALGGLAVLAAGEDRPAKQRGPRRFEGATLPTGVRAPDFDLGDESGARITMRALRGRPVIVTFLYTTCKDSCPTQAQQVKGALNELGRDVPAIAIAVDPPRDTPARARAFLSEQRMTGRMSFVLGRRRELRPLWDAYAVQPQRSTVEHNGRFVLVDPRGLQRVSFPLDRATPEAIAHDIRLLEGGA